MTAAPVTAAFDRLFDDAAIFPPGNAPMRDAVQQHRRYRDDARAALVGPFVCTAARLPELDEVLDELDAELDVSVVAPAGPVELAPTRRAHVVGLEKQVGSDESTEIGTVLSLRDEQPTPITAYVELPLLPADSAALVTVAAAGLRLKFRTGGLSADTYPTEAALAAAIDAAVEADVAFKCTAGLHNAVRHTGADGFEHHGFLNVLLATELARSGGDRPDVADVLSVRDGETLTKRFRALAQEDVAAARRAFVSFGTCSVDEPVADLRRLGLLA